MVARRTICVAIVVPVLIAAAMWSVPGINWYRAGRVNVKKAAQNGDLDTIQFVLRWRPERAFERQLTTPLWQAASRGHLDIVKTLVEHGADPNDRAANTGFSALGRAKSGGHDDIAHYLIEHGATQK